VDWRLPVPFETAPRCYHGGAFFDAIGEQFDDLARRHRIINADVLDAWFPPAPGVLDALREHLALARPDLATHPVRRNVTGHRRGARARRRGPRPCRRLVGLDLPRAAPLAVSVEPGADPRSVLRRICPRPRARRGLPGDAPATCSARRLPRRPRPPGCRH